MRHPIRRLAAVAIVGLLAGAGVAVVTGRITYVVTRAVSMQPVYTAGDLVVLARSDSYRTGQIVAYRQGAEGPVVLHRIVGGDSSGFVFKGDNNELVDTDHPAADELVGRAVLHEPKVAPRAVSGGRGRGGARPVGCRVRRDPRPPPAQRPPHHAASRQGRSSWARSSWSMSSWSAPWA